jgi:hypothetical protein
VVDQAIVGGTDGMKQELEQWLQLCWHVAVIRDEDSGEEGLVHLAPDLRRGVFVRFVEVRNEGKRAL